jgi:hypothetical protein
MNAVRLITFSLKSIVAVCVLVTFACVQAQQATGDGGVVALIPSYPLIIRLQVSFLSFKQQ